MAATEELHRSVHEATKSMAPEITAFLQAIVRAPSVNPVFGVVHEGGEALCQDIIADKLRAVGAEVTRWDPDVEKLAKYRGMPGYQDGRTFANRPDQQAFLRGAGGGRSLMLAGHIDVVGADARAESWTHDPFAGVIENGVLHGRGSVDMKGGVCAMVMALHVLHRVGVRLRGDVSVVTVVDEETGGMGSLAAVERGCKADAGIMTEPTELKIVPMCRGILWGRIRLRGKSGHVEIKQPPPDRGGAVDGVRRMRFLMQGIDELNAQWRDNPSKTHPLLGYPCEVSLTMVNAGQHPSSFAETVELTVDVQYLHAERDTQGLGARVRDEIESFLLQWARLDPWLRDTPPTFEWFVDANPNEIPSDHPVVGTLGKALVSVGLQADVTGTGFHSDSSVFTHYGTPMVNFGPGDPFLAHQTNEHIALDEVVKAVEVLALAVADWCGVSAS